MVIGKINRRFWLLDLYYLTIIITQNKNKILIVMKKKIIIIICTLFIFTGVYSQKQIKGISTYFPMDDSITLNEDDLTNLINSSYVVCSKIDSLDDGSVVKTVEIQCADTNFRFAGAYIESSVFSLGDLKSSIGRMNPMWLVCNFALVDNGELYESYELDSLGKKCFERILNKSSLVCIDPYEWTSFN